MTNKQVKYRKSCVISGFQLEYVEILLEKFRDYLDVKLIIIHPDRYEEAQEKFAPIPVLSRFDSRNGDFYILKTIINPVPVDEYIREYYLRHIDMGLSMFSRMDGDGRTIPADERLRLFWKMVSTWESFVSNQKIELMISREVPHFSSEYLLARACEHHSATVLMTEYIEYLLRRRIVSSLDDRSFNIRENVNVENLEEAKALIRQINKDYKDAATPTILNDNIKNKEAGIVNYIRTFMFFVGYGLRGYGMQKQNINLALIAKNWKKNPTRFSVARYFFRSRKKVRGLARYYSRLCTYKIPDKFIYFAANYQPEGTTIPDGNGYHYLPNVVRLLSNVLPKDWKIVYKEHPATFKVPYKILWRGHMMRNFQYYKDIQLENVVLLAPEVDSFMLIDRSQFVVSVNGTILLESVARKKSAVMFGNSWHESLPGVTKVVLKSELEEYIKSKKWLSPINMNQLEYALATLKEDSFELLSLVKKRNQNDNFVRKEVDILCEKLMMNM